MQLWRVSSDDPEPEEGLRERAAPPEAAGGGMVARAIKPKRIPMIEELDPQLEAWRLGWNAAVDAFQKREFNAATADRQRSQS